MKALLFEAPWQMPLRERADPRPGPGEVVVAVRASGICGSDVHGFTGATGRRSPGIVMGHEAAGEVVVLGDGVRSLRVGEPVALRSILPCRSCGACRSGRTNLCANRRALGMHFDGAYAERVAVPAALAMPLPRSLPYEEAALIEPLAVAMHAVAVAPMRPEHRVAIVGAGTIGLLTLLAVRAREAAAVAVVDTNARRLAVAAALGADVVANADVDDPPTHVLAMTDGAGADVVFEAVGIGATVRQSIALVRTAGDVTWVGNSAPSVDVPMQEVVSREITIRGSYAFNEEFEAAANALADRTVDVRPLVEHVAPLSEGPEIFRGLAEGRLDAIKVLLQP